MKRALIFLLLASVTPLFAQPGAPSGGKRPAPEDLIRMFDRNGDGKISRDEAPDRMKQHWDDIDADHNGVITLEELKARDARVAGTNNPAAGPTQNFSSASGVVPSAVPGTKAYVNAANVKGAHDGRTWATAYVSLQDALAARAAEIWVARGTYYPGADRSSTFQMCKVGAIYGGFSGDETSLDSRDWQKNKTILDGNGAYHVVTGADEAVLDGFTVTGGNGVGGARQGPPGGMGGAGGGMPGRGVGGAMGGGRGGMIHTTPQAVMSGASSGSGAGMLNFRCAPTVRNCVFENNKSGKGGAVYNMTSTAFPPRPENAGKAPVFIGCVFRGNTAQGRGGGVSNGLGTSPTFMNCVFEDNSTPQKGGGMYNDFGCSPTLINCLFSGNKAQSAAGMGNDGGSSPILYFCTFTKNHAVDYGAPLYQGTGPASNPIIISSVVADNLCDWEDPGIYNWHECTPLVKESANGDNGYKPGRFSEPQLSRLLDELKPFKVSPARESAEAAPERIPSSTRVVYVNSALAAPGDGRTWGSAYRLLGTALEDAGRDGSEIRVAAGTYKLTGDRSASFVLRPGVRVLGGYAADGSRDAARNITVLDGNGAYHVLVGANGAELDGLVITGGCADGAGYDGHGGGLVNYRRGPQGRPNSEVITGFTMKVSHCTFRNNYARDGGSVYSYDRGKPVFTGCLFADNKAENGGAVLDRVGVESTFISCEFRSNAARWRGGAAYMDYGARAKFTGCRFAGNTTGGHGGAIFSVSRASQLENTVVTLMDCRFDENSAKGDGGAAAFCDSSVSDVQNCVFAGNRAGRDGNDVYTDSSSSNSAGAASRPATSGGQASQGGADGENAVAMPGRAGGRMGGERLLGTFKPAADFSAVILGSGGPPYDPNRSGPSVAIQYRGRFLLVDMGNGTQARLCQAGIANSVIDAFLVTHHHRDHDEEFMPLLNTALVRGSALEIIGTPGTKKLADFTAEFYAEDIAYRIERMGRNAQNVRKPTVREIQGGESFKLGDIQVKTAQVPHTIHTVAYRFDVGGQSIVISGDLTYSDKLVELAKDANVLIIDSGPVITQGSMRRSLKMPGGGEHRVAQGHASLEDVANMARKSGAKCMVLTHITNGEVDEESTIHAIHEVYSGKVLVARDLMQIAPEKK